jgi:hypothetical protein
LPSSVRSKNRCTPSIVASSSPTIHSACGCRLAPPIAIDSAPEKLGRLIGCLPSVSITSALVVIAMPMVTSVIAIGVGRDSG